LADHETPNEENPYASPQSISDHRGAVDEQSPLVSKLRAKAVRGARMVWEIPMLGFVVTIVAGIFGGGEVMFIFALGLIVVVVFSLMGTMLVAMQSRRIPEVFPHVIIGIAVNTGLAVTLLIPVLLLLFF
jgi:hypothetical protein